MESKSEKIFELKGNFLLDGHLEREKTPCFKDQPILTGHKFALIQDLLPHFTVSLVFLPFELTKNRCNTLLQIHDERFSLTLSLNLFNVIQLTYASPFGAVEHFDFPDYHCVPHKKHRLQLLIEFNLQNQTAQITIKIGGKSQSYKVGTGIGTHNNQRTKSKFSLGILGNNDSKCAMKGVVKDFVIESANSLPDIVEEFPNHEISEPFMTPLSNFYQLHLWKPGKDELCRSYVPLNTAVSRKHNQPMALSCHDMMGGYKEDAWTNGFHTHDHCYRFLQWNYMDFFVYFSHERVTIPPPNYTDIAHSFGVKSIGTLITEWEEGEKENKLLLAGDVKLPNGKIINMGKTYYADKLVEICKYYRFDGYLLNFEAGVASSSQLRDWVKYLTEKIHQEVPGSVIIWYDSVISNGQVRWQSMLNHENKPFFEVSDYFFTDYKWDDNRVKASAQNAGNQSLKVFQGIDIFGRGSYKGAQWNTYMGVDKCLENKLSVAFFANGWTYENNNGRNTRENFLSNDARLWHGAHVVHIADTNGTLAGSKQSWAIDLAGGNGWQEIEEDGKKVSVASFDYCAKSLNIDVYALNLNLLQNPGILRFSISVKGTPPKTNDLWVALIEGYSQNGSVVLSIDSFSKQLGYETNKFLGPSSNWENIHNYMNQATGEWETHTLEIDFSTVDPKILSSLRYLRIAYMGKDVEYWQGHFGTRFRDQVVTFSGKGGANSILRRIKARAYTDLPLFSFLNYGCGEIYCIEGIRVKTEHTAYNNLTEYDTNIDMESRKIFKSASTEPSSCEKAFYFKDSWNGPSCVNIRGKVSNGKVQYIHLYKTRLSISAKVVARLVVKNFPTSLKPKLGFVNTSKSLLEGEMVSSTMRDNNWLDLRFAYTPQEGSTQKIKDIYLAVENQSGELEKLDFLLGEISIALEKDGYVLDPVKFKNVQVETVAIQSHKDLRDPLKSRKFNVYCKIFNDEELAKRVKFIRVFHNDKWVLTTRSPVFLLENLTADSEQQKEALKIQLILARGIRLKLSEITPVVIEHSKIHSLFDQ